MKIVNNLRRRRIMVVALGAGALLAGSVAAASRSASAGQPDAGEIRVRGMHNLLGCLDKARITVHVSPADADGQVDYSFDDLPGDPNGSKTLAIHDYCYARHLRQADMNLASERAGRSGPNPGTKREQKRIKECETGSDVQHAVIDATGRSSMVSDRSECLRKVLEEAHPDS